MENMGRNAMNVGAEGLAGGMRTSLRGQLTVKRTRSAGKAESRVLFGRVCLICAVYLGLRVRVRLVKMMDHSSRLGICRLIVV